MTIRVTEVAPPAKGGRKDGVFITLAIFGLAFLVVVLGATTALLGWLYFSPPTGQNQTLTRVEISSGMQVVSLPLGQSIQVERAVLYDLQGESYETATPLAGEVNALGFILPVGVETDYIEVAPTGAAAFRVKGAK